MSRPTLNKIFRFVIALALLGALIYFAGSKEFVEALAQLSLESVINLLLISAVLIYISALKWGNFLEHFGAKVSSIRLFRLYLVGYFVNLILPSYVGGDAVRSWYVGKNKNISQHQALAATILERYTGMAAMFILGVGFVWFVDAATWPIKLAVLGLAFAFVMVTIAALSARLLAFAGKIKILAPIVKHCFKVQEALKLASSDKPLLIKAMALSFLYHTFTVLNTMAAGQAVGWMHPPVWDLFVVLPLILTIGAIPLTPNGLGLQEGAFFFFLVAVGATPAQALGVGVVLRLKSYVLALLGGVCWLCEREQRVPENLAEPVP